jgi:DNA repair exonuclease SbcCD ATPase subunit
MATISDLLVKLGYDGKAVTVGVAQTARELGGLQDKIQSRGKGDEDKGFRQSVAAAKIAVHTYTEVKERIEAVKAAADAAGSSSATLADKLRLVVAVQAAFQELGESIKTVKVLLGAMKAASLGTLLGVGLAVAAIVAAAEAIKEIFGDTEAQTKAAEEAKKQAEAYEEAEKTAERFAERLHSEMETFGLTEAQKKLHEYKDLLDKTNLSLEQKGRLERKAGRDAKELDEKKKHADNEKHIADLQKRIRQHGMTGDEKALDNARHEDGADYLQLKELERKLKALKELDAATKESKKLETELARIKKQADEAGLSTADKRRRAVERSDMSDDDKAKYLAEFDAAEKKKKLVEETKKLEREAAKLQQQADQAGLSAVEKRVALLKSLGLKGPALEDARKKAQQLEDAKQAERDRKDAEQLKAHHSGPLEKYKAEAARIQGLLERKKISKELAEKALAAANKEFRGGLHAHQHHSESPKALLKGSAEAAEAIYRQGNPIDQLTEVQRQALAEQQKLNEQALALITATKENKPAPSQVANF